MKSFIKCVCQVLVSTVALFGLEAFAGDPVTLTGEIPTGGAQKQLLLTSDEGVTLQLNYNKVESAIVNVETGVSVEKVQIRAVKGANNVTVINIDFSTTCRRIAPSQGYDFINQSTPKFRLATSPHDFPFALVPLKTVVLQKDVNGGEFHTCQANLQFTVNGVPQHDPVNQTKIFHPQF